MKCRTRSQGAVTFGITRTLITTANSAVKHESRNYNGFAELCVCIDYCNLCAQQIYVSCSD